MSQNSTQQPADSGNSRTGDDVDTESSRHRFGFRKLTFILCMVTAITAVVVYFWPISKEHLIKVVGKDGKFGFINSDGRIVIELVWDEVEYLELSSDSIPRVKKDGKWAFLERDGRKLTPLAWDETNWFNEEVGLAEVMRDQKWGYINRRGEIAIPLTWRRTYSFHDHAGRFLACVSDFDEKWGWIDEEGNVVVGLRWEGAGGFFDKEGMAAVKLEGKWGFVDARGNPVVPPVSEDYIPPRFNRKGTAAVLVGDKWGLIDRSGDWVAEPIWDKMRRFQRIPDRISVAAKILINRAEAEASGILPVDPFGPDPDSDSKVAAPVFGWIDGEGEVVIPPVWDEVVADFNSFGVAEVIKGGDSVLIDRHGEPVEFGYLGFLGSPYGIPSFEQLGAWNAISHWIRSFGKLSVEARWPKLTLFDNNERALAYQYRAPVDPFSNPLPAIPVPPLPGTKVGSPPTLLPSRHDEWHNLFESGEWIDSTGNTIISLPEGGGWEWMRWKPHYPSEYKNHRYVAIATKPIEGWHRNMLVRVKNWFKGEGGSVSGTETACIAFDPEGKVIWDNRWVRLEHKCLVVLGVALLLALLTRPRRRA